jgi:hypothetical protein
VSGAGEGSVGLGVVLGAVWRRDWDRVAALTPGCPRRVALLATAVFSVGFSLPVTVRGSGLEWPRSGLLFGFLALLTYLGFLTMARQPELFRRSARDRGGRSR